MESNKIIPKKLNVPEPVAAYLAAEEAKDAEKLALCFIDDGTVRDEGEDHHAREAIQQWKQKADAKYRYVLLPLHAHAQADEVIVRARLTGDFPGSTVELDHIFKLSGDKIASLEIRP
jgi:SnoaL-like domain